MVANVVHERAGDRAQPLADRINELPGPVDRESLDIEHHEPRPILVESVAVA
jgi:hypothetical protein